MTGTIVVVGLGPGPQGWMTPETLGVLAESTDLVGYAPYLDRVPDRHGLVRHASDNRVEIDRARHAFDLAARGRRVAVVSGGDPGIFAMAAAMFEALDDGEAGWRAIPLRVCPGISAMQAAAARLGAPLGHDFCVLSLSDNLKPWAIIERRLRAVADGDFVLAIYNPASRARPDRLAQAFVLLRTRKAATTPVAFARSIGRPDERVILTCLSDADASLADMSTLVLVGSSETRIVNGRWLLTPRGYGRVA